MIHHRLRSVCYYGTVRFSNQFPSAAKRVNHRREVRKCGSPRLLLGWGRLIESNSRNDESISAKKIPVMRRSFDWTQNWKSPGDLSTTPDFPNNNSGTVSTYALFTSRLTIIFFYASVAQLSYLITIKIRRLRARIWIYSFAQTKEHLNCSKKRHKSWEKWELWKRLESNFPSNTFKWLYINSFLTNICLKNHICGPQKFKGGREDWGQVKRHLPGGEGGNLWKIDCNYISKACVCFLHRRS